MKRKEIQDLKSRPAEDLAKMIRETNEKLRQLRFDLAAGKVKNVSELHKLRKNVARMKTFMKLAETK